MKDLIKLLERKTNIDEYLITEISITSTELFFIKEELQMNRGKDVKHIEVTVYRNFEENDTKFKGSSTTKLSPTMTLEEQEALIDIAALAASFVKNEFYTLEKPTSDKAEIIPSKFSEGEIIENISNLVKDLYDENNQFGSFINSTEFFIDKKDYRVINSNGIDVSFTKYNGEIELITEANGEKESIELYDVLHFSDHISKEIKGAITEALEYAALRAKAVPMPNVEVPVILNGIAARDLWSYYTYNCDASQVYNKLHNNKVGDLVQGEDIKGDKVTITKKPVVPNSTRNSYYDINGTFLKDTVLIKDGVIQTMYATKRYADYLNLPTTGAVGNTEVAGGSYTEKELKEGPYLELLKFSAFQTDPMTGNFGGEFRLGIYFDGEKKISVTLGSIAANLKEVQTEMYLSKELTKDNFFIGPKFIKFNNVRIAGN